MTSKKDILILLSSGGMVLSCFYACTSIVMACLSLKPIPVFKAAGILFLSFLITTIHKQRRWRRIYVAALHLLGALISYLQLLHSYFAIESPFLRLGWISEFLKREPATGWFVAFLMLFSVCILWMCGERLSSRPNDPDTLSRRFDTGLGLLLLLLLVKLLIVVKEGSIPIEHSSIKSILSVIVLGLLSMGLARIRIQSRIGEITYLGTGGIILSFAFIIFVLGGGLFILFLPELQAVAETSADILKTVSRPLGPILVAMLRFALVSGCRRSFRENEMPENSSLPTVEQPDQALGIFHFLFIGFSMLMLSAMIGLILFLLIKWLFSETGEGKKRKGLWEILFSGIQAIKRFLSALRYGILNSNPSCAAEKYYKRLLRWGRFSGLPQAVSETPREYGIRLGNRFPRIEKEIRFLIHFHDEAVYGFISPNEHQIFRARLALRRIRNPLFWSARMKSLCFPDRFGREGFERLREESKNEFLRIP